jgi:hypothetical protein
MRFSSSFFMQHWGKMRGHTMKKNAAICITVLKRILFSTIGIGEGAESAASGGQDADAVPGAGLDFVFGAQV